MKGGKNSDLQSQRRRVLEAVYMLILHVCVAGDYYWQFLIEVDHDLWE